MQRVFVAGRDMEGVNIRFAPISTTLYDLVEAVMEEVGPGEDGVVTRVVMGMLEKGKILSAVH